MPYYNRNTSEDLQKIRDENDLLWSQYFWNEFVLKHEDKINWNTLSQSPYITWEIVNENPDKPWKWDWLSENPNITWETVKDNPDEPWNWNTLSCNPNITWEIVNENPDKPWDWYALSKNPNMTWEIVQANPDKPWSWFCLSQNLFIKDKERFLEQKYREHMAAVKIQIYYMKARDDPEYELCKRINLRHYNEIYGNTND